MQGLSESAIITPTKHKQVLSGFAIAGVPADLQQRFILSGAPSRSALNSQLSAMQQTAAAEQPAVGCGFGAQLLAHEPDFEKDGGCLECCDPPDTRRTWRQWARRNDCCFAKGNCAGAVLCAPWTGIKWIMVGLFTIPLFWTHFGMGLARFLSGGAFHMVCRALCHNKGSTSLAVAYYVFGGVPLMINYLLAICEMLAVFFCLLAAFFATFAASVLNLLCAVEACIELVRLSDGIYKTIFANLPVALEHPGKLVAPP